MSNDITHYMALDYPITINPIDEADGGGWLAEIPDLKGCCADGETPEEAIKNLDEAKRVWLETALRRGIPIPQPTKKQSEDEFSGKFTLRIPKSIHKELAERAKEEGMSLNQYVGNIIAYHLGKAATANEAVELMKRMEKLIENFTSEVSSALDKYAEIRPRVSSITFRLFDGQEKVFQSVQKIWEKEDSRNFGGVKRW